MIPVRGWGRLAEETTPDPRRLSLDGLLARSVITVHLADSGILRECASGPGPEGLIILIRLKVAEGPS